MELFTTWWTLKSTKIDKIHKIHAPKIQGRVFSEVAEAPQEARTQTHMAGAQKSATIYKIHKIHAPKFQGVFFLRSPKRHRQLGHRRTGLGDPETSNKCEIIVGFLEIFQNC